MSAISYPAGHAESEALATIARDTGSDQPLMALVVAGDAAAFATIVRCYQDRLVNFASKMAGDRTRGEDIAQETFARLYAHRRRYREQGQLLHWLYRTAGNLVRTEERKRRRWLIARTVFGWQECPAGGADPIDVQDRQRAVRAALANVAWPFRLPLVLHEVENHSVPEIAEIIGVPEGTIKSRISRGKAQLRRELGRMLAEVKE
jgi:RNA polymerase sigma-70 factor (ECF subfamily)